MLSFGKFRFRRRVSQLIADGVGVRQRTWHDDDAVLSEPMLAWVRDAMGGMKRPYGFDHVALALACRGNDGELRRSASTGIVTPGEFYGGDAEKGLRRFVSELAELPADDRAEVTAALVCLGDLAHELAAAG